MTTHSCSPNGRTTPGNSLSGRNAFALAWLVAALLPVAWLDAAQDAPQAQQQAAAQAAADKPADTPADEQARKPKYVDSVVVTATRTERDVENLPVSVTVVSREEVQRSPTLQLDDLLRAVPGINLPNGSSAVAYPSRNTLSMRGLSGNRALVLYDGVPLNDPMFGYIDWNRVSLASVDRVEVVRGGGASLFGSYAMGGTINVISRPVRDGEVLAEASYGSFDTVEGSASVGHRVSSRVTMGLELGAGSSDGYNRIPEEYRRLADTRSEWDSRHARLRADIDLGHNASGYVRVNHYSYDLSAGTAVSATYRKATDFITGARLGTLGSGEVAFNAFYQDQQLDTDNPAIINSGTFAYRSNHVDGPGEAVGGSLQWTRHLAGTLTLVTAGVDVRSMRAKNNRTDYNSAGAETGWQNLGGKQDSAGAFVQASWVPSPRLEVLASARSDYWRNYDGFEVSSKGTDVSYDSRSVTEFSPRVSLRYDLGSGYGLRTAVYRAFAAPMLRDLYRSSSFRGQENVPNPDLEPETMVGGEVGIDLGVPRFRGQVNLFYSEVEDAIAQVVVHTQPLLGFQPQNVGTARARGIELMGEAYLGDRWSVNAGYVYSDSETVSASAVPELEGKRLPDVPRNSYSGGVVWRVGAGGVLSARAVYVDEMYADAANQYEYDSHTLVDLYGSWPVSGSLDAFVAVTNAFDEEYLDDITPSIRRGAPRQVRVGLKLRTLLPGSGRP